MKYEFDTSHTQIEFAVKHMMFTTVKGHFTKFTGELDLDEQNPGASSVNVTIDAASLTSNDERRDGHLRSPDFLDVEQFPTITFASTKVEVAGDNRFKVTGDLTIHGVTRELTLAVVQEGKYKGMQGEERYAFTITTALNRKDHGLNWNVALEAGGWLVGEEIKITIDAEVKAAASATA
jgi:polyisoprenoid-binding protein YceI